MEVLKERMAGMGVNVAVTPKGYVLRGVSELGYVS